MNDQFSFRFLPALGTMALAALVGAGSATPAYADRDATPEERARIMEVLRAAGYESAEEIELDDGVWEVDDAVHGDGREYDLELDPENLEIVGREPD